MNFKILQDDPLKVLESTKYVVEKAGNVEINLRKIKSISGIVKSRLEKGLEDAEMGFGATGNIQKDVQLIFIEDCVNFCFWAEKDKPHWQVEWPKGHYASGGWHNLVNAFKRAIAEGADIKNPDYLSTISLEETKNIFRGINGTDIPLVEERQKNLREAGRVLNDKFGGQFINAVYESEFDAIKLVKLIIENFSSYRDTAEYKGRQINFFKRAQIAPNDLGYLKKQDPKFKFKNIDQLTAFADYKLPQILREEKVIVYSKELAEKIDNYELIPSKSEEEVEIRSATIWSVELIRQTLPKYSAGDIDNAIWLISQDQSKVTHPYHRTYSIYY